MAENLNLKTIDTVDTRPFKKLVMTIGELPTSFVESMTYYELLAWFVNYLETVIIPTVNNNAEAIIELQDKFLEFAELFRQLKDFVDNYFDNLDVQEEINNKLDQMAADGTLEEIIIQYLHTNVAWYFDTVEDMKSATNLIVGSEAKTLGFYTLYDGGGSTYKITDEGTANGSTIIELDSGLLARLVPEKTMSSAQFGLVGDGTTDDSDNFRCMTEYAYNNKCDIKMKANSTFSVSKIIAIFSGLNLNLNGSTIISSNKHLFFNFKATGTGYSTEDTYLAYNGNGNIEIHNGTIKHTSMSLIHGDNIYLHDLNFYDTDNDHYIEICACSNFTIRNCKFKGMITQASDRQYVECLQLDKCDFTSFPWLSPSNPTYDETPNNGVTIEGCSFEPGENEYNNLYTAIGSHSVTLSPNTNTKISNNIIKGSKSSHSAINVQNTDGCIIEGNKLYNCSSRGIMGKNTIKNTIIRNNYVESTNNVSIIINQYTNTDNERSAYIDVYNNICKNTAVETFNFENTDHINIVSNTSNKNGKWVKFNNVTDITFLDNNNTSTGVNMSGINYINSENISFNKIDSYAINTNKDMNLNTTTSDSFTPELPYTLFNQMKIEIGANGEGEIFTLPIECFRSDTFQEGVKRKRTVFYKGIQYYLQVEFKANNEVALSVLSQSSTGNLFIRSFGFRKVTFY